VFDSPAAHPINHLLARNSWARARLMLCREVRALRVPALTVTFSVRPMARLTSLRRRSDVTISFTAASPSDLWLAMRPRGRRSRSAGHRTRRAVNYVCRNLRWTRRKISRARSATSRRTAWCRRLKRCGNGARRHRQSGAFVHRVLDRGATLIARAGDVEKFNRDVDRLRDDIARLEKRLDLIGAP